MFAGEEAATPEVGSQIVGFQYIDVQPEWQQFCATFDQIAKKSAKLGDIKANLNFFASTLQLNNEDCVTRQVRSEVFGDPENDYMVDGVFTWWPNGYLLDGMEEEGWYIVEDDKFECFNNLELPYGESFCVFGADDGAQLMFDGEVVTIDPEFEVQPAWNSFGNCTPVPITLGDVKANLSFFASTLQLVNSDGVTLQVRSEVFGDPENDYMVDGVFTWWPDGYLLEGMDEEGWYIVEDDKFECFNKLPIKAGEGFCVYGGDDGATIIIPAAIKE